ncbi:hypothetical protein ACJEBK_29205 [Peribacillus frigoritolerans]|uniref:hypothetical protein n=1 Tax=Peribacillus frigoritolerans TaxID=450367 RepID=UPI0038723D85
MEDVYQNHIKKINEAQEKYINALTEEESKKFLLSIIQDNDNTCLQQNITPTGGSSRESSAMDEILTDSRETVYQHPTVAPDFPGPIRLKSYSANKNKGKHRKWCFCDSFGACNSDNHGVSHVAIDYNYGIGDGRYDIVVAIKHYGFEQYGIGASAWEKFKKAPNAYGHFVSARLSGPNSAGRQNYFQNGNNQTGKSLRGTLGVEVFEKGTSNQIWWGLWYFNYGNLGFGNSWGDQWLRCGHDYNFWFEDI